MIDKNKIKTLLLIIFGFFTLSGCSEWLDYQPNDKQSEAQQFAVKSGFYATVNGIYNRIGSNSLYGKYLSYELIDVLGQRYSVNSTDEDSYSQYLRALSTWDYSNESVSNSIESIWQEAYSTIMNINVIIDNIEKDSLKGDLKVLPDKEYKMLKGEMLAVRAMIHFDMLRLFGPIYANNPEGRGIPYNESTKTEVLPILPANTVLNDYIIRDLLKAEELLLASDPVIENGPMPVYNTETLDNAMRFRQLRLNYYSTVLLLARSYIWAGDFVKAAEYAQKLTNDPAAQNFFPSVDPGTLLANTVDPDRMFSTECLFGYFNKNRGLIYENTFGGASTGKRLLIPRPNYINGLLFKGAETSDYRYKSQWTQGVTLKGESSMMLIKFNEIIESDNSADLSDNGDDEEMLKRQMFHGTFCSLIKLSEAYYIAAEAYGNPASQIYDQIKAWNLLNVVRRNRGLSDASGNATQFSDFLTKEYIREFIGEGQIFFYFKRMNKGFDNDYNGVKEVKKEVVPGMPFFGYDYKDQADKATKERRFVVPLTKTELDNR